MYLDNGCGISEVDLAVIGKRYYTSKISEFEDISTINSFGFRGEALNSLCTISKVSLTTCTKETMPLGFKLEYNLSGEVIQKSRIARAPGTTIQITNIFSQLPVRLCEFKRQIKKEYIKCIECVQAYALSSTGVRINFLNVSSKGSKSNILQTKGSNVLRENVISVFGAAFCKSLLDIRFEFTHKSNTNDSSVKLDKITAETFNLEEAHASPVVVSGLLSKPQLGCGRTGRDRQFIFVNRRPVDIAKVSKSINDTYHDFVATQNPIFILNISVDPGWIDVNISPDKRLLAILNEAALIQGIQEGIQRSLRPLREMFDHPISSSQGRSSQGSSIESFPIGISTIKTRPISRFVTDHSENMPDCNFQSKSAMDSIGSLMHQDYNGLVQVNTDQLRRRFKSMKTLTKLYPRSHRILLNSKLAEPTFIQKSDFKSMTVLGQFNLGFILALHGNMIFIIDQHASDEKYRYETLQQIAMTTFQPLVQKLELTLTYQQERLILQWKQSLRERGFVLEQIEKDGRDYFQLIAVPHIRDLHLGIADLEEILAKLGPASGQRVPHCTRTLKYFASKACRQATMIGDPLSYAKMCAIIENMGRIEQPWNCPHGRPTMRLLAVLSE
ncbi:ATP-binding mismatch repair protein, variant 2 [Batrachochytrium dendrobatidis]